MNIKKTAILIFANSAQQEALNKPFSKASILFDEFNKKTLQKVKRSGLPFFLYSEEKQIGSSFGERYTNAIQYVYDQGFENVITIGNDTPQLQTSQLIETAKKLEENPIVLGPSKDGGYYLMGLNRSQFNVETFLKLPWQTSQLIKQISHLFSLRKIKILFLKTLNDIDTIADIKSVLDTFRKIDPFLKKILLSLFSSEKITFLYTSFFFQNTLKEIHFNKGSPLSLHFEEWSNPAALQNKFFQLINIYEAYIRMRTAAIFLFSYAQISVTGVVKSSVDETPIPFVTIQATNGSATTSDENGKYTISVSENDQLRFSAIGYTTQTVSVENRTTINIVLAESTTSLDEVVVTALGVKRESKELGYTVQSLKAAEISEVKAVNFLDNLAGKLAGVSISSPKS